MKWLVHRGVFTLATYFLAAGAASASTYYISISTGSDENTATQAQSKNTPWAHLPGMANATGTVASFIPQPGDVLILKGCDAWPNASFPIHWTFSGASGSPIIIDRDVSWFNTTNCPTAWNRAKFDAQNTVINPPQCASGHSNTVFSANASYLTMRWIEVVNFFYLGSSGGCASSIHYLGLTGDYLVFENWYIHHWTAASMDAVNGDTDGLIASINPSPPSCQHCNLDHFVIDNSDGLCNGIVPGPGPALACGGGVQMSISNSVLHEMTTAIKPYTEGSYHDNNIYHIFFDVDGAAAGGPHPNCFESLAARNTKTYYIYNNYFHDLGVCEGAQVGNAGEIDYIWNNIWDMTGPNCGAGCNAPQGPQGGTSNSLFFWNNTVIGSFGCFATGPSWPWTVTFTFQNNHCINSSATVVRGSVNSPSTVINHNVGMTTANAASQGYTGTTTYVYSPQNGNCNGIPTNCPIGAGINLTPSWMTGFARTDTTYACVQQTVAGVVQSVCPRRNPVPRPPSGAWDVGAYFRPTGQPQPPYALTVIVQ